VEGPIIILCWACSEAHVSGARQYGIPAAQRNLVQYYRCYWKPLCLNWRDSCTLNHGDCRWENGEESKRNVISGIPAWFSGIEKCSITLNFSTTLPSFFLLIPLPTMVLWLNLLCNLTWLGEVKHWKAQRKSVPMRTRALETLASSPIRKRQIRVVIRSVSCTLLQKGWCSRSRSCTCLNSILSCNHISFGPLRLVTFSLFLFSSYAGSITILDQKV